MGHNGRHPDQRLYSPSDSARAKAGAFSHTPGVFYPTFKVNETIPSCSHLLAGDFYLRVRWMEGIDNTLHFRMPSQKISHSSSVF
jgi:hypothetical protein